LSPVATLPGGATVSPDPVVTLLIDPTGKARVRVNYDERYPLNVNKTVASVRYDAVTNVVCGSVFLEDDREWDGNFTIKSRQKGPDGVDGAPGDPAMKIVECELDSSSVIATCPIINVRLDCTQRTLYTFCSDIGAQVCVDQVRFPDVAGALSDKTALKAVFAAAQMVASECKQIHRYEVELEDDDPGELALHHWDPQPGCVVKRHFNRHKFEWVPQTDVGTCVDPASVWYDPDLAARPAIYPWMLETGAEPATEECCQEDFFYCPNIQYSTGSAQ
jgi:hypothetical protein